VVAPAERPDIIVDFSRHRNQSIILYNDAPAPFPEGVPVNDYFPLLNPKGNPVNATTPAGFGPNSRVLMRFDVLSLVSPPGDITLSINTSTNLTAGLDPPIIPFGVSTPPPGVPLRQLTLNERFDQFGRLIQMLGTLVPPGSPSSGFGRPYDSPATEVVQRGSTEVWEIYNTTADVHPIHFHLVNVQVINRQPFQVKSLGKTQGSVNFAGPATPAEPNETGWKETVMMFPGTVTRVIMRFDLPSAPFAVPVSPRTGGNEYVWHCHILEHEEHDMMRPLIVQ
jgi:spore coat protein A